MAYFLAQRMIKGFLEFINVPASLKEAVKTELIKVDRNDLIISLY